MHKQIRKVLPVVFLVLALALGAWTANPAVLNSGVKPTSSTHWQDIPGVQDRIQAISTFQVNLSAVSSSNVSTFDKQFIEESLTSNTLELESMKYAVDKVQNPDVRSLIEMMISMHTKDLETTTALAKQLGVSTSVDLTNASVYPETPDYDLGMRTENLVEEYLTPLKTVDTVPFDELALDILSQEHQSDVQTELTAERLVQNDEIRAFAKHSADVTELHRLLINFVNDAMTLKYATPPDFQAPYQDPRSFVPGGSGSGS